MMKILEDPTVKPKPEYVDELDCPVCGYETTDQTPVHQRHHDATLNGPKSKRLRSENTVYEEDSCRVSMVNWQSTPAQMNNVVDAYAVAKIELRSFHVKGGGRIADYPTKFDTHVFLLHYRDRIIGFVMLEKVYYVWKYDWKAYEDGQQLPETASAETKRTVTFIWIHPKYRKNGLARNLLSVAAGVLKQDLQYIGFDTPFSPLGKAFVRNVCPDAFYIGK